MTEENIIFIVSQPRSGSTYLQNILSNNPQINTVSEPWIMLGLSPLLKPELINADYDFKLASDAVYDYESKFPELDIKKEVKKIVLEIYKPMFNGYDLIIDKTPRYWEILDELVKLFPQSKIIILKRNPIDVVKSMIRTWDIKRLESLNYFRRDLLLAPHAMHNFMESQKENYRVYTLKYEDLLQNPETEFKKLYNWIGLDFKSVFLDSKINKKYKGKYGDPYQNKESLKFNKSKKSSGLSKTTNKFIKGYSNFLGKDFLKSYGYFSDNKFNKTREFNFFLDLGDLNKVMGLKQLILLGIKKILISKKLLID